MSEWRQRTVAENQASNAALLFSASGMPSLSYVERISSGSSSQTRVNEDKIKQDDEIIEQFGD